MKAYLQFRCCRASTFLVVAGAAWLVLIGGDGTRGANADSPRAAPTKPVALYDTDPEHLWNRLHSALFVRTASDGTCYGQDELEPLLWPASKYLLAGDHHKRVVALLDEFLAKDGHKLIKDPAKRVVFQHDLWAVFDWLANPNAPYQYRDDDTTPEARALQTRLARVIRRLGLSGDEMQKLPDSHAAAIAAKAFPTAHDSDKPEKAFLPSDLFAPEGPWVLLGEHMRSVAPAHFRLVHGRSAFLVFLNLPGGRKATLAYLEKLAAFPNALTPRPADRNSKFTARNLPTFNPDLPQFPVGTQVALVREVLTIDDKGKIRPTRIIESIQFRVYRDIPKGNPARPEGFDDLEGKQDFFELRFTRKDLFAGTNGGLHAVSPQEKEISFLITPLPDDPFEEKDRARIPASPIMAACAGCHRSPGIHSVEAYARNFAQLRRPPWLETHDRIQQEEAVMRQKWADYSWGLLQGLMEKE